MKFITVIVIITFSHIIVHSQDFDGHFFERIMNKDPVRPQSDSNTYLPIMNIQQFEKSQNLMSGINSQQNDVTNYNIQRPSSLFTPPKISYLACGQPFFTSSSSNQHYFSMCVPQGFKDISSYNSQPLSSSLSLNIPESSSTQSSPQFPLFPTTSQRSFRSASRTEKQLGRSTGGNKGISTFEIAAPALPADIEDNLFLSSPARPLFRIDETGYDLKHPPHIHSLDVECSKTMMTIKIEFNRAFNGIIYSKGYYTNPECLYVKQNSGLTQYSFTVNLDSCGTQFINDFKGAVGQAYLENVLVLQNEPDIQEVWDSIRRIRCLWEGNIDKALTVNLSVDMLNQEIVTFSGDTAVAKLDIQLGKGPFAPTADGLIKIGEPMTLVVSVEGDPGFDLQVRDCLARDKTSVNTLQLTDERGCILKPKLFGAFQKTKDTGNTGASIIAYAFFQAFKFPDVMDLFIECNVELCKTNCKPCPQISQQIEPRRRRSVTYASRLNNSTKSILLSDPFRVQRRIKVILLDDLSTVSNHILDNIEETTVKAILKAKEVCISNRKFYTIIFLALSMLFIAIISVIVLYVKLQTHSPQLVESQT